MGKAVLPGSKKLLQLGLALGISPVSAAGSHPMSRPTGAAEARHTAKASMAETMGMSSGPSHNHNLWITQPEMSAA